jgi:hypothetical protein
MDEKKMVKGKRKNEEEKKSERGKRDEQNIRSEISYSLLSKTLLLSPFISA